MLLKVLVEPERSLLVNTSLEDAVIYAAPLVKDVLLVGKVAKEPSPATYCAVVPANISLPTKVILPLRALLFTVLTNGTYVEEAVLMVR